MIRPGTRGGAAFGFSFDSGDQRGRDQKTRQHEPADNKRGRGENETKVTEPERPGASLPVAAYRRQILYLLERHATLILLGETGSGKTTQVPQYLLEAGWAEDGHQIACTQPRRAAAASVAARVAEELGSQLGDVVGYSVRFDHCESQVRLEQKGSFLIHSFKQHSSQGLHRSVTDLSLLRATVMTLATA
jgi:ATP-dependent RNA helicase DDX35